MLAAMKIAFIGLGRMGTGMARNLLRAGHVLALYNRSREKAEPFAACGARVASSAADACALAELDSICLRIPPHKSGSHEMLSGIRKSQ